MKIIFLSVFLCIVFSACTGKQMKKYGGELALNGGEGHPIGAAIGAVVGGTIYGVGALVDNEEKKIIKNLLMKTKLKHMKKKT